MADYQANGSLTRMYVRTEAALPPGKARYPFTEAGWVSGPFWTGVENLAATGIRFPDRPSRGESLYRLSSLCTFELPHVGGVKT